MKIKFDIKAYGYTYNYFGKMLCDTDMVSHSILAMELYVCPYVLICAMNEFQSRYKRHFYQPVSKFLVSVPHFRTNNEILQLLGVKTDRELLTRYAIRVEKPNESHFQFQRIPPPPPPPPHPAN